jgi:hypothetical protein
MDCMLQGRGRPVWELEWLGRYRKGAELSTVLFSPSTFTLSFSQHTVVSSLCSESNFSPSPSNTGCFYLSSRQVFLQIKIGQKLQWVRQGLLLAGGSHTCSHGLSQQAKIRGCCPASGSLPSCHPEQAVAPDQVTGCWRPMPSQGGVLKLALCTFVYIYR